MEMTSIGNAKVAGMTDDLDMSSNDYSLALVIFFISYIIFEVPSNLIISRVKPSIYIPCIMMAWGACVTGMAFIQSKGALLALRFLVGLFEAGFAPGILLMLSVWYKKSEQSRRYAVFYSAAVLSGAFGGLVAGGISSTLEGAKGLRGWRWLFVCNLIPTTQARSVDVTVLTYSTSQLVEGVGTIACAIIAMFILLDFPANTKRLTDAERRLAISRLEAENVNTLTEDSLPLTHMEALKRSVVDWRTWLFTLGYTV